MQATGAAAADKDMFPGYKVHHMVTKPLDYGWPVQRGRLKVGLSIFGNESWAIRDLSPLHLARAHTGCRSVFGRLRERGGVMYT